MSSVILTGPLRAGSFMAKLVVSIIAIRTTFRIFLVIICDLFFLKYKRIKFNFAKTVIILKLNSITIKLLR